MSEYMSEDEDRFSLDTLAVMLSARGIRSRVDMTGGGVATLTGGEVPGRDHDGAARALVCVGPGTYGYGKHPSYGWWDELSIAPDDDDVSVSSVYWDGPRNLDAVVEWIVDHLPEYREAMSRFMSGEGE